jgi:hypothetical protein
MLSVVAGAAAEGQRALNRRDRWMKAAREHGATLQQIADAAGMTPQGVRNALNRPPKPAPPLDADELRAAIDEVAQRYGVPTSA